MTSVILIGPMGSGKTTLGKKLAKELGVEFLDTDKLIARKHGAITEIFKSKGEEYFRELESKELESALESDGVVATGGGVVLREENRNLMVGHRVIFLDTSSEHVLGKINLAKRPLLKDNPERWGEIYAERKHLYQACATETVFTGGKSVKSLVETLKELISK